MSIDWTKKITPNDKLIAARIARRNALKTERDQRTGEPISGVQVATLVDRENVSGTIRNWESLGNPAAIPWILADNSVAPLSKDDLIAIEVAYAQRKAVIFQQYQALCVELEASNDPATVVWP